MAAKPKIIRVGLVTTGGTIDKDYDVDTETLVMGPPMAPRYLRRIADRDVRIHHREVSRVDSRQMTDVTRALVVQECAMIRAKRIIITHGTGTMLKTAELLHESGVGNDHTVMLVGAWRPAAFTLSDAERNIDRAYSALFKRPPGIYIATDDVIPWAQCEKDETNHKFIRRRH